MSWQAFTVWDSRVGIFVTGNSKERSISFKLWAKAWLTRFLRDRVTNKTIFTPGKRNNILTLNTDPIRIHFGKP